MVFSEPLDPPSAKKLIREILQRGEVAWSKHAVDEMRADALTTVDGVNVLRAGVVEPPDFERGSWRYRVRTPRMTFVVAFRSATRLVVVTAWRERR